MKKIFLFLCVIFLTLQCAYTEEIVAIDIGHTPKKFGTTSARNIPEYSFNKRMSLELHELLSKNSIKSFIINKDGKEITLKKRSDIAKNKNATLFISIHHDSAQLKYFDKWIYKDKKLRYSDKFSGYSIFISKSNIHNNRSTLFANILGSSLKEQKMKPTLHHAEPIKGENRVLLDKEKGIYRFDELSVLRNAKMPALLFECGVIVNRDEELLLNDKKHRNKILNAIVGAIIRYTTEIKKKEIK